jgi:anti-anti-sigma factor
VDELALGAGLVIDLSGVTHGDSTGRTAPAAAYRRTQQEHTPFALRGTAEEPARVCQIVGIHRIMPMDDTVEHAAHALSARCGRARVASVAGRARTG